MTLSHSRHPGVRRDPGFQPANRRIVWVPTSVGMTDYFLELFSCIKYWRELNGEGCASPVIASAGMTDFTDCADNGR